MPQNINQTITDLLKANGSLEPVGIKPIEKKQLNVSILLLTDKIEPNLFLACFI